MVDADATLRRHGLPIPPGNIVTHTRWIARSGDWWACTDLGWFWFDATSKTWRAAPLGPP